MTFRSNVSKSKPIYLKPKCLNLLSLFARPISASKSVDTLSPETSTTGVPSALEGNPSSMGCSGSKVIGQQSYTLARAANDFAARFYNHLASTSGVLGAHTEFYMRCYSTGKKIVRLDYTDLIE